MNSVEIKLERDQRRVWFAYVALVLMNAIDVVYTHAVLISFAEEANPLMNYLYQSYGIMGIVFFKSTFLILLGLLLTFGPRFSTLHRTCHHLFYGAVGVYSALTAYHVYWLFGVYNLF